MHERLEALGGPARLRIARILAERPLSVGVIADRAGLRQPQATKHLQRLERAGLVSSHRSGNRRIYALEPGPLRGLAELLGGLAEQAREHRGSFDAYTASLAAEKHAADRDRWADERVFSFWRALNAPRETVWRYLTEPHLLTRWWTPDDVEQAIAAGHRFYIAATEGAAEAQVNVFHDLETGELLERRIGLDDAVVDWRLVVENHGRPIAELF
jgi:DNA-binding transcriptional ArsR family regulator